MRPGFVRSLREHDVDRVSPWRAVKPRPVGYDEDIEAARDGEPRLEAVAGRRAGEIRDRANDGDTEPLERVRRIPFQLDPGGQRNRQRMAVEVEDRRISDDAVTGHKAQRPGGGLAPILVDFGGQLPGI